MPPCLLGNPEGSLAAHGTLVIPIRSLVGFLEELAHRVGLEKDPLLRPSLLSAGYQILQKWHKKLLAQRPGTAGWALALPRVLVLKTSSVCLWMFWECQVLTLWLYLPEPHRSLAHPERHVSSRKTKAQAADSGGISIHRCC